MIGAALGVLDRLRGRPRGLDEVDNVAETVRQIGAAPSFPDVPLVVVTGGKRMRMVPDTAFAAHQEAQRDRVTLVPNGRQVIAEGSGHFPQLHEPEVVIARDPRHRRTGPACGPSPDRHAGAIASLPYHAVDADHARPSHDPDRADPRR